MIYKYIIEIKNRSFLVFSTWFMLVVVSYFYKEILLCLVLNLNLNELTFNYFIFTNITEIFSMYFKLIYFIANQMTLFFFYYHIIMFIVPGLYYQEYQNLQLIFVLFLILWLIAIIFLHKTIIPLTWKFFLNFQQTVSNQMIYLYFEAKINEVLNFYIVLYYYCFLNCLFVFVLIIFSYYININLILIKRFRKFLYFVYFFLATLITPPDIISQFTIGICFIVIFENIIYFNLFKNNLIAYTNINVVKN